MTASLAPTLATAGQRHRKRSLGGGYSVLRLLILFGFAAFCVVPLLWLLLAPTNTDAQLADAWPISFGSFDRLALGWNRLSSFNDGIVYQWMLNSLLYTASSLVLGVAISLLAGYALATLQFPGRKAILVATLLSMLLPATATVLPLFLEINAFHLVNTAWSVILPASFYPFGVYLAFVFFATSVPKAVLEASAIDGCTPLQTFRLVVLPIARPLVGLLTFFSFVAGWSNFFLPYIMLTDQSTYNLPVGLAVLLSSGASLSPATGGTSVEMTRPEAALAGLLVVVPVAILFIVFQRFLVQGILAGSVKS